MIEKLLDRWFLLPLVPGAELVVATLVVGAIMILLSRRPGGSNSDRLRVPMMVRVTSGSVVVVWIVDIVVQAFWVTFPMITWWSFGLPLFVTAAGTLTVAFFVHSRTRRTGEPVVVGIRRTWWSFTDRLPLIGTGTAGVLILVVTLICGAASSPDEYGRYAVLDSGDAGVGTFYGWAFGIPTLIGLLLLIAATLVALSRIATPSFLSTVTVRSEIAYRSTASNALLYLTGSALILTLGAILKMIGVAGSGSAGVGIPGVGDFVWSLPYSSFAQFFVWSGWVMQVASFVMLIILALGSIPLRTVSSSEVSVTGKVARSR